MRPRAPAEPVVASVSGRLSSLEPLPEIPDHSLMSLTPADVEKVARLARLKLTAEEQSRFVGQLGEILEYVRMLDELDTSAVEPAAHAADLVNVFRNDEPRPSLDRSDALANAPRTDGKYFLVPQILEGA